jgi:hypothetical protein
MTRKIDFAGRHWSAHAQDHWLEFAGNSNFPDYLRITFVAYGRHAANGHAKLQRGELARYLIRKDGTLPDRRTVWRGIETAGRLGYLLPESRQLCLVVSSHDVQGGRGDASARCTRDHTIKPRRTSTTATDVRSGTSPASVVIQGRTSTTACDVPRSTPLSLLQTSTPDNREESA